MALIDNLVSYWKLDEFSDGSGAVTRVDSHGSNNLTDNNTTPSATGIIALGADLERGNSEYLSISDASQTGLDITGDLTISMWLNFESVPINTEEFTLLAKRNSDTGNRSYGIYYDRFTVSSTKSIVAYVSSDGSSGNQTSAVYSTNFSTATWYHLVWVYSTAGTSKFYINGTEVASIGSQRTSIFNGNAAFIIGATGNSSVTSFFDGVVDEVGIWSRVLTADEITELYNSGAGLAYPFAAAGPANLKNPTLLTLGVG